MLEQAELEMGWVASAVNYTKNEGLVHLQFSLSCVPFWDKNLWLELRLYGIIKYWQAVIDVISLFTQVTALNRLPLRL
jgi:hypothetical protein